MTPVYYKYQIFIDLKVLYKYGYIRTPKRQFTFLNSNYDYI